MFYFAIKKSSVFFLCKPLPKELINTIYMQSNVYYLVDCLDKQMWKVQDRIVNIRK